MTGVATARLLGAVVNQGQASPKIGCPAGYTFIVKDLVVANQGTLKGDFYFIIKAASGTPLFTAVRLQLEAAASQRVELWIVLEEGDSLYGYSALEKHALWVSGTILFGAAPPVEVPGFVDVPTELPSLPT